MASLFLADINEVNIYILSVKLHPVSYLYCSLFHFFTVREKVINFPVSPRASIINHSKFIHFNIVKASTCEPNTFTHFSELDSRSNISLNTLRHIFSLWVTQLKYIYFVLLIIISKNTRMNNTAITLPLFIRRNSNYWNRNKHVRSLSFFVN